MQLLCTNANCWPAWIYLSDARSHSVGTKFWRQSVTSSWGLGFSSSDSVLHHATHSTSWLEIWACTTLCSKDLLIYWTDRRTWLRIQITPAGFQPIIYWSVGSRLAHLQKQTFTNSSASMGMHHPASQGSAVAQAGRCLNISDHAVAYNSLMAGNMCTNTASQVQCI